jgi:hypothetical protein
MQLSPVRIATADWYKVLLTLPNARFSVQKVLDTAGTWSISKCEVAVLNDANHGTVANNGVFVSVEHRPIKCVVFAKNGYHTVYPIVRSRVGWRRNPGHFNTYFIHLSRGLLLSCSQDIVRVTTNSFLVLIHLYPQNILSEIFRYVSLLSPPIKGVIKHFAWTAWLWGWMQYVPSKLTSRRRLDNVVYIVVTWIGWSGVCLPAGTRDFFVRQYVHIGSGADPGSNGYWGFFLRRQSGGFIHSRPCSEGISLYMTLWRAHGQRYLSRYNVSEDVDLRQYRC